MADGIVDKVVKSVSDAYNTAKSVGKQLSDEASGVASKTKNVGEYASSTAQEKPASVKQPISYDKPINPAAKYGDKPGEKRIDVKSYAGGTTNVRTSMFDEGVDSVPAMLTPGERVVKKSDNKKLKGMSNMKLVQAALAHGKQESKEPAKEEKSETPSKELKEIRIRKGAGNKGRIIEHHHLDMIQHPMEEHVAANRQDLLDHVDKHMGDMDEPSINPQSAPEGV